ncbi:MAG: VCBS repeat-containing protein [Verrucomicrobiia bacterium]
MPTPTNLIQALIPLFSLSQAFTDLQTGNFFGSAMAPDTFASLRTSRPYPASLSSQNTNPNGVWKLYATSPFGFMPPAVLNILRWELIIAPYSQNDYVGDNGFHYVAKKGKKVYVVNQTNVVPIAKSTPPTAMIKAKIVAGADLDGDHISDLIVKKGKTVQGLKGPTFTSPTHSLIVKGMKPVASGDFDGDLIPDLYLQKKTSLYVAINNGTGFEPPKLIADKTLPKKFKIFGALTARSQPAVLAQNKTTIAQLDGPTFATANQIVQLTSKKIKAGAVGQYVGDYTGSTIILQQKKVLSFHSPFVPGTLFPFVTNTVKGVKLVVPK